jgi:hypothetical protein
MVPSPEARSALLVAFHFPPFAGSSGQHRTVAMARHLGKFGWDPLVLTASERAYEHRAREADEALPSQVPVCRAFALDAARNLSIGGRYPRSMALPDRWVSWLFGAVPAGLRMIARHRPQVIWSTYPLATAHLIGWTLHRLSGLPWIADFRDPMVEYIGQTWYPENPAVRRSRLFVERRVAAAATAATFCTATARDIFVERHGWDPARCAVIENGFDEAEFEAASELPSGRDPSRLLLLHSGTLYPGPDRDPGALLGAVASLRRRGALPRQLRIILRATGFDDVYRPVIERLGLRDIVELAPALGYREALREVLDADGLLLFQGHTSNPAIPAKAYEYLRAARPILALVAEDGETAALLRRLGVGTFGPIADEHRVERALEEFLRGISAGTHRVLSVAESALLSRRHRVAEFAELMDKVAFRTARPPMT